MQLGSRTVFSPYSKLQLIINKKALRSKVFNEFPQPSEALASLTLAHTVFEVESRQACWRCEITCSTETIVNITENQAWMDNLNYLKGNKTSYRQTSTYS